MANRFWVGGTGSWDNTTATHWSASTGGAGGATAPAIGDNVFFDANSGGGTVSTTTGLNLVGTVDFTGWTGTLGGGFTISASGDVTLGTTGLGFPAALVLNMRNAGGTLQNLTSNGKTFNQLAIGSGTTGGNVKLADATIITGAVTLTIGTLDRNSLTHSWGSFSSSNTNARTLAGGPSLINLTGTGTVWNTATATNLTFDTTSTIALSTAATANRTFAGGGQAYGTLQYTVANSPGLLIVTGANTFNTVSVNSTKQIQWPASTTNTVTNWSVNGSPNGYLYLPGVSGNTASTPNSAAVSVTGDITIDCNVALDNWAGAAACFIAKVDNFTTLASFQFETQPNGFVRFLFSNSGATWTKIYAATAALSGLVNGSPTWVRVTRVASTGNCTFYQSSSAGGPWTQIGAVVAGTTGNMFASTSNLVVGATNAGTGTLLIGKVYQARMYSDVTQTTKVFDADFTSKTVGANTFTESSSNAATVTINGVLARAGDGRVAITSSTGGTAATLSFLNRAVSDYITVQDNTATTTTPAYAGANGVLVSGTTNWLATAAPAQDSLFNELMLMGIGN